MKINRRDFLKTTAATSLFFAGFGLPSFASQNKKQEARIIWSHLADKAPENFPEKNFSKVRLDTYKTENQKLWNN